MPKPTTPSTTLCPWRYGRYKRPPTTFSGAAAGLRTCVKDLLALYHAFLQAAEDQFATGQTSTPGSPLKQMNHLMSAQIPMDQATPKEASYGCGWARAEPPGPLGTVECNPLLMSDGMPIVGKGAPPRLVFVPSRQPAGCTVCRLSCSRIRDSCCHHDQFSFSL